MKTKSKVHLNTKEAVKVSTKQVTVHDNNNPPITNKNAKKSKSKNELKSSLQKELKSSLVLAKKKRSHIKGEIKSINSKFILKLIPRWIYKIFSDPWKPLERQLKIINKECKGIEGSLKAIKESLTSKEAQEACKAIDELQLTGPPNKKSILQNIAKGLLTACKEEETENAQAKIKTKMVVIKKIALPSTSYPKKVDAPSTAKKRGANANSIFKKRYTKNVIRIDKDKKADNPECSTRFAP